MRKSKSRTTCPIFASFNIFIIVLCIFLVRLLYLYLLSVHSVQSILLHVLDFCSVPCVVVNRSHSKVTVRKADLPCVLVSSFQKAILRCLFPHSSLGSWCSSTHNLTFQLAKFSLFLCEVSKIVSVQIRG